MNSLSILAHFDPKSEEISLLQTATDPRQTLSVFPIRPYPRPRTKPRRRRLQRRLDLTAATPLVASTAPRRSVLGTPHTHPAQTRPREDLRAGLAGGGLRSCATTAGGSPAGGSVTASELCCGGPTGGRRRIARLRNSDGRFAGGRICGDQRAVLRWADVRLHRLVPRLDNLHCC
jgi:hypothetical protein